jgi:hypothetical protein
MNYSRLAGFVGQNKCWNLDCEGGQPTGPSRPFFAVQRTFVGRVNLKLWAALYCGMVR